MKKEYIYITFAIILMLLFNTKLDALTCKYQNPIDPNGEDLIIEFTDKNDKPAREGDMNVNTCIDGNKTSFFGKPINLHLWSPIKNNWGLYDKESYFVVDGAKWTFNSNNFKGKNCTEKIFGKDMTCPALEYQPVLTNSSIVNVIQLRYSIPDSNSTPLVLKSGSSQTTDKDGNVTDKKTIGTCSYTLDLSNVQGGGAVYTEPSLLEVIGWSDGTTTMALDSAKAELNFNEEYPFNVISNTKKQRFLIKKDEISKFLVKDVSGGDYELECLPRAYIYYDLNLFSSSFLGMFKTGSYVITTSKDKIPDDTPYTSFGQTGQYNPEFGQLTGGNVSANIGTCVTYLGSASTDGSIANFLDKIYDIIKVLAIIIAIVWSMLDLAKVIINDKDELSKVVKKVAKRLVILLIILLLPLFIDIIGNLIGKDDILCGIR